MIRRLASALTDEFRSHPILRVYPRRLKESFVCFSGFLSSKQGPRSVFAVATNTKASNVRLEEDNGPDGFKTCVWYQDMRANEAFASVQRIGNWSALGTGNENTLEQMLRAGLPAEAVRGKAFEIMRLTSESSLAGRSIGAQVSAITIPRDANSSIDLAYRSNVKTDFLYLPDMIVARTNEESNWYTLDLMKIGPNLPALVPKTPRNWPCPCGRGKKFKHCHGRNRAYR